MPVDDDLREVTSYEDLNQQIARTPADANVDVDKLRRWAFEGRYQSKTLRCSWFAIGGLGRTHADLAVSQTISTPKPGRSPARFQTC